ncbi:hypothetical protein ACFTSD_17530 [Nocardiaceae bacterium NPDC056970]
MSSAADRMWEVRDLVLAHLYEASAEMRTITELRSHDFGAAIAGASINENELDQALKYLLEKGYAKGKTVWGGQILRPEITAFGEDYVARGLSVRGPADGPRAVPSSVVIHASGNTNVSVGSHHVTQSIESGDVVIEKVRGVAAALEKAAAGEGVPAAAAEEARDLAQEIGSASDEDSTDKMKLRALLGKVLSSAVVALGTAAGSEVATLAIEALPLLSA